MTVELGDTYTEAGATADGGEAVTVTGTVDTETVGSYTVTYSATDASGNTGTATRTVNVVDTSSNAPVFTAGATLAVDFAENSTDPVTTLAATDADAGDTVTYTLKDELDADSFNLVAGVLTFKEAPDFETKSSYSITAVASDGVNEATQAITVTITNVNEAPVFESGASAAFNVTEGNRSVGILLATDADAGDIVSYTLEGADAGSFDLGS